MGRRGRGLRRSYRGQTVAGAERPVRPHARAPRGSRFGPRPGQACPSIGPGPDPTRPDPADRIASTLPPRPP